jgi:hypothetical protein
MHSYPRSHKIRVHTYMNADFMPMGVAAHRVPSVGFEDHMHSIY